MPTSFTDTPKTYGDGALKLVISCVAQLTPRVRAYQLRDPNGALLPTIEAGSHLQLPVKLNNGEITLRHYSICSNPARRDLCEIVVLQEDKGLGGSQGRRPDDHPGLIEQGL